MAFTVRDYQDMVRLLSQHPEWQAELRRLLLADDFLALPTIVRDLAEAQVRTEVRLEALTARVEQLAEAQARTEIHLEQLTGMVGELWGENLERRHRERPFLYFRRLLSEPRVLSEEEVVAMIASKLSDEELDEVLAADVIVTGRRPDGTAAYLVVEISQTVRVRDVERAVDRARLFAQAAKVTVLPVVAGQRIRSAAEEAALQAGVWRILDRRTYGPDRPAAQEQVTEEG